MSPEYCPCGPCWNEMCIIQYMTVEYAKAHRNSVCSAIIKLFNMFLVGFWSMGTPPSVTVVPCLLYNLNQVSFWFCYAMFNPVGHNGLTLLNPGAELGWIPVFLFLWQPLPLGTQGAVFECFPKAMTALGVSKSNQMTLARRLSDHALLSLSKIIKSRRQLEYTALGPKAKKPPDKH